MDYPIVGFAGRIGDWHWEASRGRKVMTFEEDICPYQYPFSEDGQPRSSSPALQHRHYRNERCCFEGWGFCMIMAISSHRLFVVGSLLDVMRPRLPHLLHPTLRQLRRSLAFLAPFIFFLCRTLCGPDSRIRCPITVSPSPFLFLR